MPKARDVAIAVIAGGLSLIGAYVGTRLATPKVPAPRSEQTVVEYTLDSGKLALRDFNGDATPEFVYFPNRGPPALFAQVGNEYSADNPLSTELYRDTLKFSGILAGESDFKAKQGMLQELERSVPLSLQPLIAYAALQDPNLALIHQNKLLSANTAMPLLAELYETTKITDLVLKNPKSAAAAGLLMIGSRLLQDARYIYTGPPSYAQWTKSGPGWEDVGTIDSSGMVKVSPGSWVSIRNTEALKMYEDLRKDPNVIYTSSGYIRLEHPIGESRSDYYTRTERETAQRNLADAQRRQLEQSAQQFGKDVNKQLSDWDKKMQEMFKQKK
jgi:hypothetical protein